MTRGKISKNLSAIFRNGFFCQSCTDIQKLCNFQQAYCEYRGELSTILFRVDMKPGLRKQQLLNFSPISAATTELAENNLRSCLGTVVHIQLSSSKITLSNELLVQEMEKPPSPSLLCQRFPIHWQNIQIQICLPDFSLCPEQIQQTR